MLDWRGIGGGHTATANRAVRASARRGVAGLLATALVALLVAGCGTSSKGGAVATTSAQQAVSQAEIPVVNWGMPEATTTLDPWGTAGSEASVYAITNAVIGLTKFDVTGNVVPDLAKSWREVSPLEYVYELRPDARFSDGKPVTVDDVVFSLRRGADPKTGGCCEPAAYTHVKSIEATGPHEVTIRMSGPDPAWPNNSAIGDTQVSEKAVVLAQGKRIGSPEALPIGAGPYKIAAFVPDDHVTLVRNPYYFGPKPKAAKVVLHYVKDAQSVQAAVQSGSIDGTFRLPLSQTPQYQRMPNIKLISTPGIYYRELDFNTQRKPFNDVHVRRAFAYAWDRADIVRRLLHGNAEVASGIQAPWMWVGAGLTRAEAAQRLRAEVPQYPYDMAKAKAELAKSAYPHGFSASVEVASSDADLSNALQVLATSLQRLNIHLTVKEADYDRWAADLFSHDYGLMTTFNGTYLQPITELVFTYQSGGARPNGFNFSNYKNPQMDALLKRAVAEPDERKRADLLLEVDKLSQTDLPHIVAWWEDSVSAISRRLVFKGYGVEYYQQWAAKLFAAAKPGQ